MSDHFSPCGASLLSGILHAVSAKHSSFNQVKVQHWTIYTEYRGINWPQVLCLFSALKTWVLVCVVDFHQLLVDIALGIFVLVYKNLLF